MTCKSCTNYRFYGCSVHEDGWPNTRSDDCPAFVYLPGSDEAEDDELPEM